MAENSLSIFSQAAKMLAKADSIQKTKELKSMALTALEWARQKQLGKEAEQHCYSYAMEAERKMGQLILERKEKARKINTSKIIKEAGSCIICGYSFKPILIVHHIIPVSEGGTGNTSNLIVLCPNCHATAHRIIEARNKEDAIHLGKLASEFIKSNGDNVDKYMPFFERIIVEAT